jgi:hypothetical protein
MASAKPLDLSVCQFATPHNFHTLYAFTHHNMFLDLFMPVNQQLQKFFKH